MINKLLNTPAIITSLLMAVLFFGTTACQQNVEEAEGNLGTNPDTSRDSEGDTFSIVAYDKTTGQVGGAGCSCVSYTDGIDFLNVLVTDGTTSPNNVVGAFNAQASPSAATRNTMANRLRLGDTPQQAIIATNNSDGSPGSRQYGVVGVDSPGAAGWTGSTNTSYANDQQGDNALYTYSIQGNILDTANGQDLLDDMEAIFNSTDGTLGDKLMAALQAAKRVGGDSRCQGRGNSGRTAFIKVLTPGETSPGLIYDIGDTTPAVVDYIEPIDVLQCLYDIGENTPHCRQTVSTFPYSMDFEETIWEQEVTTCNTNSSWIRSRFASPSSGTGPTGPNQGTLYTFVEASNIDGQGTSPRNAMIGSPCFEFPSGHTVSMTFDYHMLGGNMGTLSVEASDNGGSSWNTLWSRTGDQGASWINDEFIDLSAYAGSTVKIRINALLGNGFTSDMAIDDIQITTTEIAACTGPIKTWNGSSWSPSGAPDSTNPVIIDGTYDTDIHGVLDVCTLTINAGETLTLEADDYVRVNADIVVDGSLLIAHTGSLVQVDEDASVTNNGTINVDVTTPVLQTRDFMVMGSPMDGETRNDVFDSAFLVLNSTPGNFLPHPEVPTGGTNFADDNGDFWNSYTGAINVGEGYIVRPQSGYTDPANTTYDMTYSLGTLNNGDVTRPIVFNGLATNPSGTPNILANPYASAIDADQLIADNALIGEVYFWEHLTPPSSSIPGAGGINFSMGDISMYNTSMALPAANDPGTTTTPNGVIATAQGFGIKAQAAGTVTFSNDMRLTSGNTTLRNPEGVDKLTLRVFHQDYGIGSYAGIAFNPTASEGWDVGYDTQRLATAISLFSQLQDGKEQLAIQTLPSFESGMKIPMGFASQVTADTAYTITIADIAGDNLSQASVYLIDNVLNTITDLTQGDYTFRSNEGTFEGRFTLQFEYEVLGTNDLNQGAFTLYPNPTKDLVTISATTPITQVAIYDLQGRLVQTHMGQATRQLTVTTDKLTAAMYFVTVTTQEGTLTKRLVKQ